MDIYVRFHLSDTLSKAQRHALELLAEHEEGKVGGVTEVEAGELTVHNATALCLFRYGFAERTEEGGVAVTRKGLIHIGNVCETPTERKNRKAREALDAQASGEWQPVPAGFSAQASRDAASARRDWAEANAEVGHAEENVMWHKQWLRTAREWHDTPEAIRDAEHEVAKATAQLERARANRDALAHQQKRAA